MDTAASSGLPLESSSSFWREGPSASFRSYPRGVIMARRASALSGEGFSCTR